MNFARIKKIAKKIQFNKSIINHTRILTDAYTALENSTKTMSAINQPNFWSTIMKKQITKTAAVAVIAISGILSIFFLDKAVTPAYALEQTIEAYKTLHYLHIKYFDPTHKEPREVWLEYGEDGNCKKVRVNMPSWESPIDGPFVAVWKDNKLQLWFEKSNTLGTREDKNFVDRFNMMAREADPRLAADRFYKLRQQKQVEMEIIEPPNKTEPIKITATYLPGSPSAGWRWVLFVDRATKLITQVEIYRLKNGEYSYEGLLEYYDYNQPIDDKMFNIEDEVSISSTAQQRSDAEFAQKVAQLDINTADLEQVKKIFGQPTGYRWKETLEENNLPQQYLVVYPNDFVIYMKDNHIIELRFDERSNYVFRGKLRSGSTLDEVLQVIGYPEKTVDGDKNELEDGVLYKDIDGKKGHCYYCRTDQNVRLWFNDYKISGIYILSNNFEPRGGRRMKTGQ